MIGKKGSAESAGKYSLYLVIVIFYFIFFIIVVDSSTSISPDVRHDVETNYTLDYCSTPRYKYDPSTLEINKMSRFEWSFLDCQDSIGVKSQSQCNNIEGCNWAEVGNEKGLLNLWCLFGCADPFYTCNGTIDSEYYGVSSSNGRVSKYFNSFSYISRNFY
jgi:hypothetical protein